MDKYQKYVTDDFVTDEFFIRWVKKPDEETEGFWNDWIAKNPHKSEIITEAREKINLIQFKQFQVSDDLSNKILKNIQAGIHEEEQKKGRRFLPIAKRNWYLSVAASVALLLSLSLVYFLFLYQPSEEIIFQTSTGEIKKIWLPDSSKVILNANSTLRYHLPWKKDHPREVNIEGEASFKITKIQNPQAFHKSFIVHTDAMDIQVLGTKFIVNTRRKETRVVLSEGQVKVTPPLIDNQNPKSVYMEPGEMLTFNKQTREIKKQFVDTELYTDWEQKKLILRGTPLSEIIQVLEDDFNYEIILEDASLGNKKFVGTFPTDDLEILWMTLSKSIKVTQKDNQIIFNKKENSLPSSDDQSD